MKCRPDIVSNPPRQATTQRIVLLYVDDRQEVLKIRKRRLESIGYSVITATNAHAALTILEHTTVSAVIVEYKNEGMDPEAVAFQVKQRFPHEPVILLSAYSDMPERTLWLVDDYVMRSAPLSAVAETIARVTHVPPPPESRPEGEPKGREAAA